MKNRILAIEAAPAAIPPNPNTAAIRATTRNITVQRSIIVDFSFLKNIYSIPLKQNSMPHLTLNKNTYQPRVIGVIFPHDG